jgi:hypothetical protein
MAVLCAENPGTCETAPAELKLSNPRLVTEWNMRLPDHPSRTFFHSAEWARVLEETYGLVPIYFTSHRGGLIDAMLPVMEVNSWVTGRRGVSLPFTDHCETLGDSEAAVENVIAQAVEYGREHGWGYFECRGESGLRAFAGVARPSVSFFGHQLRLGPDAAALFAAFRPSVRRAIRKAEKSGVTVEISQSLEAVQDYYELHCQIRKQHGVPPQPFRFFRNIQEHVLQKNLGIVVSARLDGRVVASAIFLHSGAHAIFKFGASDTASQNLRGNNLVMWQAIQWFAARGIQTLDFGRTSVANEGLRRFKLGWNTEERSIHYYKFDLRKDAFVTQGDDAHGWHGHVFRALPVRLSRWTGSVLYKHVA